LNNMIGCRMELVNEQNIILNYTDGCAGSPGGGNISATLFTGQVKYKLWGRYYIDIGDGYFLIDRDAMWITNITDYSSDMTIWDTLNKLRALKEFGGDDGRQEYSRVVGFFFLLILIWGFLTYSTGWDMQNPGGIMIFLCCFIWIGSFTGFLNLSNISLHPMLDKYAVAMMITLITMGYFLNNIRRTE